MYLLLNNFVFPPSFLSAGSCRLLFAVAAGVPVVPGLRVPPGSLGGRLLLPALPLHLLLPRLRPLLCGRPGGARGRAHLQRPLPVSAAGHLLRVGRVSGVLPGVLRDLPSQLEGGRGAQRLKPERVYWCCRDVCAKVIHTNKKSCAFICGSRTF